MIGQNDGFLQVKSSAEVESERQKIETEGTEEQQDNNLTEVAKFALNIVSDGIHNRKQNQIGVLLQECMRSYKGEYGAEKLGKIKAFGGSDIYIPEASIKCRAATALLTELFLPADGKTWDTFPTPNPTLSEDFIKSASEKITQDIVNQELQAQGIEPTEENITNFINNVGSQFFKQKGEEIREQIDAEIKIEAEIKAANMAKKIDDQLTEGGWRDAMLDFFTDLPIFPYAAIGWSMVKKKVLRRTTDAQGTQVEVGEEIVRKVERISPFDLYWTSRTKSVHDGDIIERIEFTVEKLNGLIGTDGANEVSIKQAIMKLQTSFLDNYDEDSTQNQREHLEHRSNTFNKRNLTTVGYKIYTKIPGSLIIEWDVDFPEFKDLGPEDVTKDFDVSIIVVKDIVVMIQINPDPLARRPLYVTSYVKLPGSIVGLGVIQLMKDTTGILNATGRALINNMMFASGPVLGVHKERLASGEQVSKMVPNQVIQLQNPLNQTNKALEIFQADIKSSELIQVMTMAKKYGDDATGLPAFLIGNQNLAGAGRTSSGLQLLQGNSKLLISLTIAYIDKDVVRRIVEDYYNHNMLFIDDPSIKGDLQVKAIGLLGDLVKDKKLTALQAFRERLDANTAGLLGTSGLLKILRQEARLIGLDVGTIPDDDDVINQLQSRLDELTNQVAQQVKAEQEIKEIEFDREQELQDDEQDFELIRQGREHENQIRLEKIRQNSSAHLVEAKEKAVKGSNQTVRIKTK